MLNCAICDDDKSSAELIYEITNEYPVKLNRTLYLRSAELLSDLRCGKKFDLYILDIVMPEFTGLELAREIRRLDSCCVIIFITGSDEFHKDAFDVEALHYLDKPVKREMLFHSLDRALRYLGENNDDTLPIQTKTGLHVLHINKIVYAEAFRHIITFHFSDGSMIETLDSSLSLEKLICVLPSTSFCSPYRGFIVNLNYVDCLRKLQLSMTTGALIPIPQKQFSRVRKQYSDYLLARYAKGAN